ncbi:MAG: hypothetical protein HQ500_07230 [Flavobacteriales bacterium]|nr:hypothetical protein [Flavobacteriales bacterium]
MKRVAIILGLTALVIGMSSCKKCYQCTALDEDQVAAYSYPEICGSKGDYDNYQERCEVEFGAFEDFTCSCAEVK